MDFFLGYSPERIDPGNADWRLVNTPKVVSGVDAAVARGGRGASTTSSSSRSSRCRSPKEAELTKLLENTFRHVNIALVNELAVFAARPGHRHLGGHRRRLDQALRVHAVHPRAPASAATACPIDPSYLSWQVRRRRSVARFRFVELANDINEHMPDYVVERLMRLMNTKGLALSRCTVLVLGLAYKRNSSDPRESPATEIIEQLLDLGAEVRVNDRMLSRTASCLTGPRGWTSPPSRSEPRMVVLVTDHDSHPDDLITGHAKVVFDTRARLTGPNVVRL